MDDISSEIAQTSPSDSASSSQSSSVSSSSYADLMNNFANDASAAGNTWAADFYKQLATSALSGSDSITGTQINTAA
jgi:hypothetical protein